MKHALSLKYYQKTFRCGSPHTHTHTHAHTHTRTHAHTHTRAHTHTHTSLSFFKLCSHQYWAYMWFWGLNFNNADGSVTHFRTINSYTSEVFGHSKDLFCSSVLYLLCQTNLVPSVHWAITLFTEVIRFFFRYYLPFGTASQSALVDINLAWLHPYSLTYHNRFLLQSMEGYWDIRRELILSQKPVLGWDKLCSTSAFPSFTRSVQNMQVKLRDMVLIFKAHKYPTKIYSSLN